MGRARSLVVLCIAVLAALTCLPAAAPAASFTWALTSDFTSPPSNSNPDNDSYGGRPWSYEQGGQTLLLSADNSFNDGLSGWRASPGGSPFIAINRTGSTISNGSANYPEGQVVLHPQQGQPATVAWASPLAGRVQVTWSTTADETETPLVCPNAAWTLMHGSNLLGSGTGSSGPQSTTVAVQPHERITLAAAVPGVAVVATCADTSATLTITEAAQDPSVTLTNPANGATITGREPTFSGRADGGFGVSNAVIVRIYTGVNTSGIPTEALTTTASGGTFSVFPTPTLPDGIYAAQAEQDSSSGAQAFSAKSTFVLKIAAPTIVLNSPGAAPLSTATPTLTGIAARNQPVTIAVYPGDTTNSTPVGRATGSSDGGGRFSIRLPSLRDGQYTVIAGDGTGAISHPVTFRIKVHPPALTLTDPVARGHLSQLSSIFLGAAGDEVGDSSQVSLTLFAGSSTRAKNLGTRHVGRAHGAWTLRWPKRLALGTYTVRVSQGDDARHTTTITRTFTVVPATSAIGSTVSVSGSGAAAVPVWCSAPSTQTCTGTVLILTKQTYQASGGGLAGRLRVMFAYVSITGGRTITVRRPVQADALRALRRARQVPVVVIATLRSANGRPRTLAVTRFITFKSARRR